MKKKVVVMVAAILLMTVCGFADELNSQDILDGHLLGSQAYRLVRVTGEGISSETVSWADLIDAHA